MPNALPERVGFRMPLGREMLGFHHLLVGEKADFGPMAGLLKAILEAFDYVWSRCGATRLKRFMCKQNNGRLKPLTISNGTLRHNKDFKPSIASSETSKKGE
jgi:hypothetical protein